MNIIYPENSVDIIQEIVKKYNFSESLEEVVKNLVKETSREKREEIIGKLPNYKIAKIISQFAKGLISEKALSKTIEEELMVSLKIAEEINKTLQEKIIPFIEFKKMPESESQTESPEMESLIEKKEETRKSYLKPDNYREDIE
jgi:hypothetical protein